jgi:hypothetical protein
MKTLTPLLRPIAILFPLIFAVLNFQLSTVYAQGTAFTYQGRLNSSGNPVTGSYDIEFTVYPTNQNGSPVTATITNIGTFVTNSLFTTTIDFGGVFTGGSDWLEIAVRTNGGGSFTTLAPRQQLTPTPYAIFANTASNLSGSLLASQLGGQIGNGNLPVNPVFSGTVTSTNFTGNGAGLTNLSATNLNGILPAISGANLTSLNSAQLTSVGNVNGGFANFFVGPAGNSTTSGSDNTATGFYALQSDTSGGYNTAAGLGALSANTTGNNNIALGFSSGSGITTGSGNIDIGNFGLPGDNNTIRIGTPGNQATTFIAEPSTGTAAG